ncbi:MAG: hypothetical protein AMXMBFR84_50770 [Candidatus Hydrogenedentota bacterium]
MLCVKSECRGLISEDRQWDHASILARQNDRNAQFAHFAQQAVNHGFRTIAYPWWTSKQVVRFFDEERMNQFFTITVVVHEVLEHVDKHGFTQESGLRYVEQFDLQYHTTA